MSGKEFGGRPIYVDAEGKNPKAGYKPRGDHDRHTKYNDKMNKKISKRKDEEGARRKIKNFKPKHRRDDDDRRERRSKRDYD